MSETQQELLSQEKTTITQPEEYKMVFCVRNDLKMGKGKIAAQCGHAVVECVLKSLKTQPDVLKCWHEHDQTKVALRVDSLEQLLELENQANQEGIVNGLITDLGRTQIAPNTITVLGIGPDTVSKINKITGHLKLLN
ncbi:peptidyl-tRNA hydrolase, putative [Entamoeba dispar SAW760]|uniref:peptidyl-tRNA hydrolase n=1 Tax=Entamoeba dispar (strain ATCC PRA-260 / SAW760) TaxID=370354 RepID=B0E7F5_ENTDS|nr:peptidyl-tRNA hydrolase, putative [Entamoeba dispar SAW760]EDR29542.1 peptidyl-tRNA hydrolase, putative [Entamoeba dispar SAW760]|eukprot:EDR29542.1 peptidyl-tRNA hydrolase, putative [Entamoeba dispar SAW760]